MKADAYVSREIDQVLHDLLNAYKARDIEKLMACFSEDDDASLIGTSADEQRIGAREIRVQAERDWTNTEAAEIVVINPHISCAGRVAWVFAEGAFNLTINGQLLRMPARMTWVLEKRENSWRIQHAHFSTPGS